MVPEAMEDRGGYLHTAYSIQVHEIKHNVHGME